LPFPYTVAAAVHLGSLVSMIRWPATEQNNGKIELDPISTKEWLWQFFAICGYNGTESSYIIFTEKRNFTTAKRQRKNSNGTVETRH